MLLCHLAALLLLVAMLNKIPCKRCLIAEIGKEDALKSILEYQKSLKPDEIADKDEYLKQLSICKDCKWLNMGTCEKIGTYVEARFYKKGTKCPIYNF